MKEATTGPVQETADDATKTRVNHRGSSLEIMAIADRVCDFAGWKGGYYFSLCARLFGYYWASPSIKMFLLTKCYTPKLPFWMSYIFQRAPTPDSMRRAERTSQDAILAMTAALAAYG